MAQFTNQEKQRGVIAMSAGHHADAGANIDEVHHQRAFALLSVQNVELERVVQTRRRESIAQMLAALAALAGEGFKALDQPLG